MFILLQFLEIRENLHRDNCNNSNAIIIYVTQPNKYSNGLEHIKYRIESTLPTKLLF